MAAFALSDVTAAVSEAEPCGPDLDLAGDPDYLNFMARAEGVLPVSFLTRDSEGRPSIFDRTTIDFATEIKSGLKFLGDTRDLRVLVLLAKLFILNRDLSNFVACIAGIASLTQERWDDVHPRGDSGDYMMRTVSIESLDDNPTSVLPLQHVPLVVSRRHGTVHLRSHLIALGEAKAREGEDALDGGIIQKAFDEADVPALIELRNQARTLQTALETIRATFIERAGYDQAIRFEKLLPSAGKLTELLDGVVARRDPSQASAARADTESTQADGSAQSFGQTTATIAINVGPINSVREAAAALAAAAAYFCRCEPSSPAILLIRQAEQLVGKSFLEVIQLLMPNFADQAMIRVGQKQVLELPLERLSALNGDGVLDSTDSENESNPAPIANARVEAITLLRTVGAYYRIVEPSSPIPLLTDRACDMAQRDFAALLMDVLPNVGVSETDA
jgi:type VI secretion system protein ImpA